MPPGVPPSGTDTHTPPPPPANTAVDPEPSAPDIVIGRISLTKGEQPVVAGRLISARFFDERFGKGWRERLEGRRLRVKGTPYVYVCGPEEQCLLGGEIPQVRDVRKIDICISSTLPPVPGERGVPCPPPAKDEQTACFADCEVRTNLCNASSPPSAAPGGCAGAEASCRQACTLSGDPDFRSP